MEDRIRKELTTFDVNNEDEDERNRDNDRKDDKKGKATIIIK